MKKDVKTHYRGLVFEELNEKRQKMKVSTVWQLLKIIKDHGFKGKYKDGNVYIYDAGEWVNAGNTRKTVYWTLGY